MLVKVDKVNSISAASHPEVFKDKEKLRKIIKSEDWECTDMDFTDYASELDEAILEKIKSEYGLSTEEGNFEILFALPQEIYEEAIYESGFFFDKFIEAYMCDVEVADTTPKDFEKIFEKVKEGYMLSIHNGYYLLFNPDTLCSDETTKKVLKKAYMQFSSFDVSKYTRQSIMDNTISNLKDYPYIDYEEYGFMRSKMECLLDFENLLIGRTDMWNVFEDQQEEYPQYRFGLVSDSGKFKVVTYMQVCEKELVLGENGPI